MDVIQLAIILVAALGAGRAAEVVGIPAVVGEIIVGLALGPTALGLVDPSHTLSFLAELGVLLLMFQVGLGLETEELRAVGTPALRVAVIGVVVPFAAGAATALALGIGRSAAMFLGATLVATSVGITARTFSDLGVLDRIETRVVLGAAVADDVLGLIVLSVVVKLATAGSISVAEVATSSLLAVGFLVVAFAVGIRVVPPLLSWVRRHIPGTSASNVAALVLMLILAEGAARAGLAPLIGALVAGMLVARTDVAEPVSRGTAPLAAILVPVFFVTVGIEVDLGALGNSTVVILAAALFVVGAAGKLVAGLGAGARMDGKGIDRLLVGIAMVPRGEVGLAFAAAGLSAAVLDDDRYAAVVVVVLATTVAAPLLIRWRLGDRRAPHRIADTPGG